MDRGKGVRVEGASVVGCVVGLMILLVACQKSTTKSSERAPESGASAMGVLDAGVAGDAGLLRDECKDSSECPPGDAICCLKPLRIASRPYDPNQPADPFGYYNKWEEQNVCTNTPEKDCEGLELCSGASCRRPAPKQLVLHCGGAITCTSPTSACALDLRSPTQLTRGEKLYPPKCIGPGDPTPSPGPDSSFSCLKSDDCPRGAQCMLGHFTLLSSTCSFNRKKAAHGAHQAPMCTHDAECAELIKRYPIPEDSPKVSRCRQIRGAPAGMRACEVPSYAQFW